jgi:tetratricopeptide (TPR) repeat protein
MMLLTGAERSTSNSLASPLMSSKVRRPPVSSEEVDSFELAVKRGSQFTNKMLDEGEERWRERAVHVLEESKQFARIHVDSPTAAARVVQAASVLGERAEILEAATMCLESIRRVGEVDTPALYVALSALISIGEVEEALGFTTRRGNSSIDVLKASALADMCRFTEAEELVETATTSAGLTLYAYLVSRRDLGLAVQTLRRVLRTNPRDVNASLMLSQLRARAGLWRQAIQLGIQATRLAPGRRDASLSLLQILQDAGKPEDALAVISALKRRKVVEPPDFLVMQASVHLQLNERRRAIGLLKQAAEKLPSNAQMRAEIVSNIEMLRWSAGEISETTLVADLKSAFAAHPNSLSLAAMLFDTLSKTSDADVLEGVVESLAKSGAPQDELTKLRARVAYVKADWSAVVEHASVWRSREPGAQLPARMLAMIWGQIHDRWSDAAEVMQAAMTSNPDPWLANDAAYVFALAGQVSRAREAARLLDSEDYASRATLGLVTIVEGRVLDGLRLYREAAELTDSKAGRGVGRALMTIHQAMALRRVSAGSEISLAMRAGSLPAIDLPSDWSEYPSFRLLEDAARKQGWEWPVVIG